jgi:CDP-6-deoxy-D-xylo-4-hexulose-3-dehydrase
MEFKNIDAELNDDLRKIIKQKIGRSILPGHDYIPVTGKVINEEDLLNGVEAVLDGWLTAGRFSDEFERELAR